MREESATSIGAALLAFAASQHHNLHMALIALGLGGSGMTFMRVYPGIRRGMLLASVVMAAVSLRSIHHGRANPAMRTLTIGFSVLTLAIIAWSVIRFGL